MVLCHTDLCMNTCGLIHLIIQFHLLDNVLQERTTVCFIIYCKLLGIAQLFSFDAQDTRKDTMECTHIEVTCTVLPHNLANTTTHLIRSLISESQSQDTPWFKLLLINQISNLVGEYTRFA